MDILKKKTSMLLIGAISAAIVLIIIGTLLFSGMTKNQKSKEIKKLINTCKTSHFVVNYTYKNGRVFYAERKFWFKTRLYPDFSRLCHWSW